MKKLAFILASAALPLAAQYGWDFSQTPLAQDAGHWAQNGTLAFGSPTTFSGSSGGSILYNQTITGANSNDYEFDSTYALKSGGGAYIQYFRAAQTSLVSDSGSHESCSGSYYYVEIDVPTTFNPAGTTATVSANRCNSGTLSTIASVQANIADSMTTRLIVYGSSLMFWVDGRPTLAGTLPATLPGNPGLGGYNQPSGSGYTGAKVGHHDIVAPAAPIVSTVGVSALPNQVNLQWAGTTDDLPGIGLFQYNISRGNASGQNMTFMGEAYEPEWSDDTAAANTTYTYQINAEDYHGNNSSSISFTANTPPTQAVDPRRIGVHPPGSYWGGAGEQVDTESMNLNFTVPLVTPQGRGNWSVPFNLTYNSQNWRQDTGGTWKLGYDVGYGFGWQLLAGSITPYYYSWMWGIDHYVFTDATGAQYHLTVNTGGIWSSAESVYAWFDANAGIVHFRDGSFWTMGCTSGGDEADAGTMYPTQMEDANGNLVILNYLAGAGVGTTNTSARISTIEDVRGKGSPTYIFTYTLINPPADKFPHLLSITNAVQTPEAYSFSENSYTLDSPFSPTVSYGSTYVLNSMTQTTVSTTRNFSYDASHGTLTGSGELLEATMPDGGNLQWVYTPYSYSNGRTYREVQNRFLTMSAGATALEYQFSHNDSGNPNSTVHANTTLRDASGAQKEWIFYTQNAPGPAAWAMGLVSTFQNHYLNGTVGARDVNYTWTTDPASNPYISQTDTIHDDQTQKSAHMRQTQTLDKYGNVTAASTYDYNSLTTAIQTWTNTYPYTQNSSYDTAYLRSLLVSSQVTDNNGHNATLVTNTYDGTAPSAVTGGTPLEWDTTRGISYTIRGNLAQSVSLGQTTTYTYDVTGHSLTGANSTGTGASATYSSATNWAAPDALTPAAGSGDVQNGHPVTQAPGSSLQNQYTYSPSWPSASLVSTVMPNAATTSENFNSSTGLLTSSVSVYGATTNYAYVFDPTTVTATTNSHWTKSYRDGFGREIANESGYGTTVVSHTDTIYGACACSPLGKVVQVSQPYGINGSNKITSDRTGVVAWTTYAYDSLGRTTSVTMADGSVTQYSYSGNTVTVTDPAGNWKTYTSNALGQLTVVAEPNPIYPSSNYLTSYTYDIEGHLVQAYMQRPTSGAGMQTQMRTFNYSLSTGLLTNATNPESGTVSYTYFADGLLASKTDAKGQQELYSYDGYGRISYIDRYPAGSQTADPCQSLALTYDSSSGSAMGRLQSVSRGPPWTPPNLAISCGGTSFAEIYSYNPAGQVTYKRYGGNMQTSFSPNQAMFGSFAVGEGYTYDKEGTLTGYFDSYYENGQLPTYTFTWTYSLDSMERPIGLGEQDQPSGNTKTWVQNVAYGPSSELHSMQFATSTGAFYTENRTYNNQLQLANIAASGSSLPGINLTYVYNTGKDNGQALSVTDGNTHEQVTYSYDQLSRLTQAETTQSHTQYPSAPWWGQAYSYDGFGNLLTKTPVGPGNSTAMSLTVNSNTNQYTTSGYGYDLNGNTTSLPQSSGNLILGYDVENHFNNNMDGVSGYDMENEPLQVSGSGIWPVYDLNGRRLRHESIGFGYNAQFPEFDTINYTINDRNVYFGGRMIQSNSKTVLVDRTGSVRADETGATFEYLPYGEEFTLTSQDREKFATYTRSSVTGLDFAQQRWYDSVHGAFITPDPYTGSMNPGNPGSFNRYSYVAGDPINRRDPSGLDPDCGPGEAWDGDGCTVGAGPEPPPQYDASLPTATVGSPNAMSPDISDGYNDYVIGNSFLGTAGAAAIEGLGTLACVGSGICEVVVGIGAVGVGGWASWQVGTSLGNLIFSNAVSAPDTVTTPKWNACVPPVGTIGYRIDRVPPSRPHKGVSGTHVHLYKMNQNPNDGQCFWQKVGTTLPPPPPGAVPIGDAAGGGQAQ